MRDIRITANDSGRRLDRFLRKYLKNAPLGEIYKLIRKDVKVDGKRRNESYMLSEGETLSLYLPDAEIDRMTGMPSEVHHAKRQFSIIYEDDNILIVSKPYGLLTHGDRREKKNHLANQVKDYLMEQGAFDPRTEKVFSPAPANRLDRNTTGLVLFGKNSASLKALNETIRNDLAEKYYLTVSCGIIEEDITLRGSLSKDEDLNRAAVHLHDLSGEADPAHQADTQAKYRDITTIVRPLSALKIAGMYDATLAEIQLVTGRTHQIRAHLASIGHPVAGDAKYASAADTGACCSAGISPALQSEIDGINDHLRARHHLTTQLLHAYRICFAADSLPKELAYLSGKSFTAPLPETFRRVLTSAGYDADAAVLRAAGISDQQYSNK